MRPDLGRLFYRVVIATSEDEVTPTEAVGWLQALADVENALVYYRKDLNSGGVVVPEYPPVMIIRRMEAGTLIIEVGVLAGLGTLFLRMMVFCRDYEAKKQEAMAKAQQQAARARQLEAEARQADAQARQEAAKASDAENLQKARAAILEAVVEELRPVMSQHLERDGVLSSLPDRLMAFPVLEVQELPSPPDPATPSGE
jgi:hypothetical protein